jgi:microsomal dipeptidase-like Zn-dependent dipeptidase
MVVTHPMSSSVRMNVAQMQEAAKAGAFLELVYVPTLTNASINRKALFSVADVANTIRKVGTESVILSTDMGQVGFPPPPNGMAAYIAELRAQGFTQRELDRMTKENPARLLGLPVL